MLKIVIHRDTNVNMHKAHVFWIRALGCVGFQSLDMT